MKFDFGRRLGRRQNGSAHEEPCEGSKHDLLQNGNMSTSCALEL